jgi:hypothetical protein
MLRHVALVRTDVSEERSASFIRVTRIGELGTTLAVTSTRPRATRRNIPEDAILHTNAASRHLCAYSTLAENALLPIVEGLYQAQPRVQEIWQSYRPPWSVTGIALPFTYKDISSSQTVLQLAACQYRGCPLLSSVLPRGNKLMWRKYTLGVASHRAQCAGCSYFRGTYRHCIYILRPYPSVYERGLRVSAWGSHTLQSSPDEKIRKRNVHLSP